MNQEKLPSARVMQAFQDAKACQVDYYPSTKEVKPIHVKAHYGVNSGSPDYDPHNLYWHWSRSWVQR